MDDDLSQAREIDPPEYPNNGKDTEDGAAAYEIGIEALAPFVDYMVTHISSPNTPGLREFQARDALAALVDRLMESRSRLTPPGRRPLPLLIKIAPDLDDDAIADIAVVAMDRSLDGLIIGNTTIARDGLASRQRSEAGGLSGRPLFARSTALLAAFFRVPGGRIPLIGVGGVASGADAYAKIRAGASLIQLYTALIFHGPGLIESIKTELAGLLARDGFTHIADAVGVDSG